MIEGTDCKAFKARRFESCEIEGIEITCEQETDVCCTARGEVGGKKTCREQYTCNPDQGLPLPPPGPPPGTTTSTSSSTTTVTAETTTTTSDSSTTASTAAADSETTKSTSQPTPISGPNSPPTDPTDPLNPQLPPSMIGFYLPPGFEF